MSCLDRRLHAPGQICHTPRTAGMPWTLQTQSHLIASLHLHMLMSILYMTQLSKYLCNQKMYLFTTKVATALLQWPETYWRKVAITYSRTLKVSRVLEADRITISHNQCNRSPWDLMLSWHDHTKNVKRNKKSRTHQHTLHSCCHLLKHPTVK